MNIATLVSICQYVGDKTVCAGKSVMAVGSTIVTIPPSEFSGWTALEEVIFPEDSDLITIGASSFARCTNLQTINFPPKLESIGNLAFSYCSSLTSVHLPASLNALGSQAFYQCTALVNVSADEDIQVTAIGGYIFGPTAITTFAIWKNLESISGAAFEACYTLEEFTNPHNNPNFNVIDGVLYAGTQLNLIPVQRTGHFVVPKNTTSLMSNSFRYSRHDSISFEEGSQLSSFGSACFSRSRIKSFQFPDNGLVKAIAANMFNRCQYLTNITIPNSITTIGDSAFAFAGLEFINVSDDHPKFASIDGILYSKSRSEIIVVPCNLKIPISSLLTVSNYTIPKEVTSIGNSAFLGSQIKQIEFEPGSTLNSVGTYGFGRIIQSSFSFDVDCPLSTIPGYCFEKATGLTTIHLPRHLKSIDGSAFSDTGLVAFIMPLDAKDLVSIDGVLYSQDKTKLYRFPPAKTDANYEVPSSVITVGSSAFETCKGILTLVFAHNSKLQNVEKQAFASSSIVTVIFADDSDDVTFDTGCFTSSAVQYITLPGKMKVIRDSMFKDCGQLVGITLPESVTSIGTGAFTACLKLSKLSIPRFCSIRSIPSTAFANTPALTELELPYLVSTIVSNSLPTNLKKLTLWCSLTPSVIEAARILPMLQDVYILCSLSLETSEFVSTKVKVHHMCFTKKVSRGRVGKPYLSIFIVSMMM